MSFLHTLWIDTECRSRVDLKKHGVYRYVECPDHRILIAGYALDDGPVKSAFINGALPPDLSAMLADPRVQVRAHNAAFDRLQLGDRAPPIERWYCTAAQARGAALPGSLENLGRAYGAKIGKDAAGKDLMAKLSIPDKHGNFSDDPDLMTAYAAYCRDDVRSMRECSKALPQLTDDALAAYWASERVNERGLPIDVELCELAVRYAGVEAVEAAAAVVELSAGALRTVRGPKLTEWVYARLDPALRKHMEVPTTASKLSLATDIRANLLEIAEENPDAIAPEVVAMIEAAEAGSLSSTAKFRTMLDRVSPDGRLRGAFTFNGAYQTNRWSSTGAQVHNFPRLVAKDPEEVLARMRRDEPLDNPLLTLKSMLRPAICPGKGKVIVRADWSAVEARALPWLADNVGGHEYLQAFTDDSRDIYIEQARAAGLGNDRQAGKVAVLSLGYGGGAGALAKMAKNYGVRIADMEGVVSRWRKANAWVSHRDTGWWSSLRRCAMQAMAHPGKTYRAGRAVLALHGEDLTMTLPSGQILRYPKAVIVEGVYGEEIEYLKASRKPTAGASAWPKARLWHGVIAENADQAACAGLLRGAVVRAVDQGLDVIGHVHDEIILESTPGKAKAVGVALSRCMLKLPAWASGLPLKVEVDTSPRFRK